jgi:hypothetical protein
MPTLADASTFDSKIKGLIFVLSRNASILAAARPFANSFFESELPYPEFSSFLFKRLLLKNPMMNCQMVTASKDGKYTVTKEQDFVAIPYYAWAHRGKRKMAVWLNRFAKGG